MVEMHSDVVVLMYILAQCEDFGANKGPRIRLSELSMYKC